MSTFADRLNEYLSDQNDSTDIRVTVRRLWNYSFKDFEINLWDGEGELFTTDGRKWLGTRTKKGNFHKTPRLADGRDGTAPTYDFTFGYLDEETYEKLKTDETQVFDRPLTCHLALLRVGEGLRPNTPIVFFKEVTMISRAFSENLVRNGSLMLRRRSITIIARDQNFGRSNRNNRTYADTMQKEYALQLGAGLDRGCEFLGTLAYRTYKVGD